MAAEEVWRGLIGIDFESTAPEDIAAVVQAIQSQIGRLSSIGGGAVGTEAFTGLMRSGENAIGVIGQLESVLTRYREMASRPVSGGSTSEQAASVRVLVGETDVLLRRMEQVRAEGSRPIVQRIVQEIVPAPAPPVAPLGTYRANEPQPQTVVQQEPFRGSQNVPVSTFHDASLAERQAAERQAEVWGGQGSMVPNEAKPYTRIQKARLDYQNYLQSAEDYFGTIASGTGGSSGLTERGYRHGYTDSDLFASNSSKRPPQSMWGEETKAFFGVPNAPTMDSAFGPLMSSREYTSRAMQPPPDAKVSKYLASLETPEERETRAARDARHYTLPPADFTQGPTRVSEAAAALQSGGLEGLKAFEVNARAAATAEGQVAEGAKVTASESLLQQGAARSRRGGGSYLASLSRDIPDPIPGYEFTPAGEGRSLHRLTALGEGGNVTGEVLWHKATGEIASLTTEMEHQRKGVATGLWAQANEIAGNTSGVVSPQHSSDRTAAGDAWARSLGGELPPRTSDPAHPDETARLAEKLKRNTAILEARAAQDIPDPRLTNTIEASRARVQAATVARDYEAEGPHNSVDQEKLHAADVKLVAATDELAANMEIAAKEERRLAASAAAAQRRMEAAERPLPPLTLATAAEREARRMAQYQQVVAGGVQAGHSQAESERAASGLLGGYQPPKPPSGGGGGGGGGNGGNGSGGGNDDIDGRLNSSHSYQGQGDPVQQAQAQRLIAEERYTAALNKMTEGEEGAETAYLRAVATVNSALTGESEAIALRARQNAIVDTPGRVNPNASGRVQAAEINVALAEEQKKLLIVAQRELAAAGKDVDLRFRIAEAGTNILVANEALAKAVQAQTVAARKSAIDAAYRPIDSIIYDPAVAQANLRSEIAGNKAEVMSQPGLAGSEKERAIANTEYAMATKRESALIEKNAAAAGGVTPLTAPQKAVAANFDSSLIIKTDSVQVQLLQTAKAQLMAREQTLAAAETGVAQEQRLNRLRLEVLNLDAKIVSLKEREAALAAKEANGTGAGSGGGLGSMGMLSSLKYFAFYQIFSMAQRGLSELMTTTEQYSLAINQLSISMGTSYDQAIPLAAKFTTIGSHLGTQPSVAINAATEYGRVFEDKSVGTALIGAKLGSTIELLEARTAKDGEQEKLVAKRQNEIAAIALNYNLGPASGADLYGSATHIAQSYGVSQSGGALLGGTAQISDLLKQSGFSASEGMSAIGAVMQRTSDTSEAAASDLKRVIGRSGTNTLNAAFLQYGIDPRQTFKEQMVDLSAKYKTMPEGGNEQNALIAKLGGNRVGNVALALLQNIDKVDSYAAQGDANPNQANIQAQKELGTFAGALKTIGADVKNLAQEISNSGLGAALGGVVGGIHPLLEGVMLLTKGLNSLDGAISAPAVGLTVLALAMKAMGGIEGTTSVLERIGEGTLMKGAKKNLPLSQAGMERALAANAAAEVEAAAPVLVPARQAKGKLGLGQEEELTRATDRLTAANLRLERADAEVTRTSTVLTEAKTREAAANVRLAGAETEVAGSANAAASSEQRLAATQLETAGTGAGAGALSAVSRVEGLGGKLATLAGAAGSAAFAIAPLVVAIGGILLLGKAKEWGDARTTASDEGTTAVTLAQKASVSGKSSDIKAAVNALKTARDDINKTADGSGGAFYTAADILGKFNGGGKNGESLSDNRRRTVKQLDDWVAATEARLQAVQEQLSGKSGVPEGSVLFGKDYGAVDQGIRALGSMKLSAGDSATQMSGLLDHTVTPENLATALTPQAGMKGLADEIKRIIVQAQRSRAPGGVQAALKTLLPLGDKVQSAVDAIDPSQQEAGQAIMDQINKPYYDMLVKNTNSRIASIKAFQGVNTNSVAQIRDLLMSALQEAAAGGDQDALIALGGVADKAMLDKLVVNLRAQSKLLHDQVITQRRAEAILAQQVAAQAAEDEKQLKDLGMKPGQDIMGGYKNAPTNARKFLKGQLDANGKAIAATAKEIQEAKDHDGSDGSNGSMAAAGLQAPNIFLDTFKKNLAIEAAMLSKTRIDIWAAIAAQDAMTADQIAAGDQNPSTGKDDGQGTFRKPGKPEPVAPGPQLTQGQKDAAAKTAAGQAAADKADRALNAAIQARDYTAPTGSAFKDSAGPKGPTPEQIEEARLAAQVIPGDPLSAAMTNLRVAQYKMSEPKNQVEYWTALKALHEAQYAMATAQMTAANDAFDLTIDMTNPLLVAQEKVREAARQLSYDKGRGALSDVTNKDKLALKQAQSAAEKTAFDQQFSDQSTNYNLQRESLGAYLSYLHAQHNYLTAVRSKTRQQVDELNQVDQALQGLANSMQGQFNLGQIKVPSPYEARRIEAGGGASVSNVQITINGADITAVKAVLTQYVGQGVMATAGTASRKV